MENIKAEFFYRKPLKKGEPKPQFGLSEPDPNRPDHKSFLRDVKNARDINSSLAKEGFKETNADEVYIVSHITRNEFEAQQGKMLGAHRLVHNDFTPNFNETVKPLIEESKIDPSKISVYNLWRRFDKDSLDAPFAVCDSSTVSESELIPTDSFNYLDGDDGFTVEIYQSSFNDNHQWYYYPKMQKDEVLMFKTFDSLEKPFLPTLHSAFDDISVTETVSPRESIEVRAICLFK